MARKANPVADRSAGYFSSTEQGIPAPEVLKNDEAPMERAKRTYYLPTDTIVLLDEIQTEQFRKTGKKPDLSELVDESIQLLAQAKRAS